MELLNTGPESIVLDNLQVPAVNFTAPVGSGSLAVGSRLVVCKSREHFDHAYGAVFPGPPAALLVCGFTGELDNSGEPLTVLDAQGVQLASIVYNDKPPWPVESDGFGPSVELACEPGSAVHSAADKFFGEHPPPAVDDGNAWRSSGLLVASNPHVEFGGTPGRGPNWPVCAPAATQTGPGRLLLTELMYHPVGDDVVGPFELHEFVEIYNADPTNAAPLAGVWLQSASGRLRFRFPDTVPPLPPLSLALVARDPSALRAEYGAAIPATVTVHGPWRGSLGNGGDLVFLGGGANGGALDWLKYDDELPWPAAADAFGASDDELPAGHPYKGQRAAHQFRGLALSRRSTLMPTEEPYTWRAAEPTPGQLELDPVAVQLQGAVLPIVTRVQTGPAGRARFLAAEPVPASASNYVLPNEPCVVRVRVEPAAQATLFVASVTVRYRTYDPVTKTTGATQSASAAVEPEQAGQTASARHFQAQLPAQVQANTIVQYWIEITWQGAVATLPALRFPDPLHPTAELAYFVHPPPPGTNEDPSDWNADYSLYHLFIAPEDWALLWTWTSQGRTVAPTNCPYNDNWNRRVPATLVYKNRVIPVQARYSGSRYNRDTGWTISKSLVNSPPANTLLALTWRITLPRYGKINGRSTLLLHKANSKCVHLINNLVYRTYRSMGVPGARSNGAVLRINGRFFRYFLDLEHGDAMIENGWDAQNTRCYYQTWEALPHHFKSHGDGCLNEGPYGCGDLRPLPTYCNHNPTARYEFTYARNSHEGWANHDALVQTLVTENDAAWRAGGATARAFVEQHFDVNMWLNHVAVGNYHAVWDCVYHNFFLAQRLESSPATAELGSDGRWTVFPWDMDLIMGYRSPEGTVTSSIWRGEQGDRSNYKSLGLRVRYTMMPQFRDELRDRFRYLTDKLLQPAVWNSWVDDAVAQWNESIAVHSVGGWGSTGQSGFRDNPASDWGTCATELKQWVVDRSNYVRGQVPETARTRAFQLDLCPQKPNVTAQVNADIAALGPPVAVVARQTAVGGPVHIVWGAPRRPDSGSVDQQNDVEFRVQRSLDSGQQWQSVTCDAAAAAALVGAAGSSYICVDPGVATTATGSATYRVQSRLTTTAAAALSARANAVKSAWSQVAAADAAAYPVPLASDLVQWSVWSLPSAPAPVSGSAVGPPTAMQLAPSPAPTSPAPTGQPTPLPPGATFAPSPAPTTPSPTPLGFSSDPMVTGAPSIDADYVIPSPGAPGPPGGIVAAIIVGFIVVLSLVCALLFVVRARRQRDARQRSIIQRAHSKTLTPSPAAPDGFQSSPTAPWTSPSTGGSNTYFGGSTTNVQSGTEGTELQKYPDTRTFGPPSPPPHAPSNVSTLRPQAPASSFASPPPPGRRPPGPGPISARGNVGARGPPPPTPAPPRPGTQSTLRGLPPAAPGPGRFAAGPTAPPRRMPPRSRAASGAVLPAPALPPPRQAPAFRGQPNTVRRDLPSPPPPAANRFGYGAAPVASVPSYDRVESYLVEDPSAAPAHPCPTCGNMYATDQDLSFHQQKRNH